MPLQAPTLAFLRYLHANPQVRRSIAAAPDRTLLYTGHVPSANALAQVFEKPMFRQINDQKSSDPGLQNKETLPDVLRRIPAPGSSYPTLYAYVHAVEIQVPQRPDGFTIWKALSGIFAANAVGKVSFFIGYGVDPAQKVFAATEVAALHRNPKIDQVTRDMLAYYERCIKQKDFDIGVSLLRA